MHYTFSELIWLVLIYSFLGWFIETIVGTIRKKKFVNRGFSSGPFCFIYGTAALIMIISLEDLENQPFFLFLGCMIIATTIEWFAGKILERMNQRKWWDYSDMAFNIQGRICLTFSIAWAALGVFIIKVINPIVDKVMNKIPVKVWQIGSLVIVIFMFIDWIVSSFAMQMFFMRIVDNHHIELKDGSEYIEICRDLYQKEWIKNIVDTFWNDEVMVKTFPNLRVTTKSGAVIYVSKLYPEIHPYYIKVFEPIHLEKFEFKKKKKEE